MEVSSYKDMDGFRQPIVLSGAASLQLGPHSMVNTSAKTSIVPPRSDCTIAYGKRYSQLLLHFDEQALLKHLEWLTGNHRPKGIDPSAMPGLDAGRLLRLKSIALALALQLSDRGALASATTIELDQALKTSFLIENGIGQMGSEKPAPDRVISRLEDYIQANWSNPLTVEDIARECAVSVRGVYVHFQKKNGCSPIAYVRDLRLNHARRLLQDRREKASVLSVALKCGFSSFGHFASRYEARFGELPSTTVARLHPWTDV